MVPWAVSTACTLFTPKSSVLTWMPVTGQFSMIWWQSHSRVSRAGGQPCPPDMQPPNLGKVKLSHVLSALSCSERSFLHPPFSLDLMAPASCAPVSQHPSWEKHKSAPVGKEEVKKAGDGTNRH